MPLVFNPCGAQMGQLSRLVEIARAVAPLGFTAFGGPSGTIIPFFPPFSKNSPNEVFGGC